MGSVGKLALQIGCHGRQVAAVARQGRSQRPARRHVDLAHRQRPGDPPSGALQAAQHVLGLDREGGQCDFGGYGRIAVAVPAHPGAPRQERFERGPSSAREGRVERPVDVSVHERKRREDRLVEQRHERAHLVERPRAVAPDRVRPPQARDLLTQVPPRLGGLIPAGARVLQPVQLLGDAPQVLDHRAAFRLRRVRRQDRCDAQAREQRRRPFRRERCRDRVLLGVPAAASGSHRPYAVVLFREVHQLEVRGEGADHVLGSAVVEAGHQLHHGPASRGGGPAAERDRRLAQALDLAEQIGPAGFGDHVAQERREQAHVPAQWVGQRPLAAARCSGRAGGHAGSLLSR